MFYTYLWLRYDGTPYYVGKGTGRRAFTSWSHGVHKPTTKERVLVQEFPTEEGAFAAERFLIVYYGRKDLGTGTLRNLTDGGEGNSGFSEEIRKKCGNGMRGKKRPPRSKAWNSKFSETRTGMKYKRKTHCIRGHERTIENVSKKGGICKLCLKLRDRRRIKHVRI